jgi:hypothetical protein
MKHSCIGFITDIMWRTAIMCHGFDTKTIDFQNRDIMNFVFKSLPYHEQGSIYCN